MMRNCWLSEPGYGDLLEQRGTRTESAQRSKRPLASGCQVTSSTVIRMVLPLPAFQSICCCSDKPSRALPAGERIEIRPFA